MRAEVLVTLTNYDTCERRVFLADDPELTREEQLAVLLASTAIPHLGLAPIAIRGARYCDGAYTSLLPLEPLESHDLDQIWLIPLWPWSDRRGPRSLHGAASPGRLPLPFKRRSRLIAALLRQLFSGASGRRAASGPGRRTAARKSHPPGQSTARPPLVLVAPEDWRAAARVFQPIGALTFSTRNIDRLRRLGQEDALRVWQERQGQDGGQVSPSGNS